MAVKIHPTAIVEDGAELGTDVEVGPFSYVARTVKVGDRSILGPHVVVEGHTTLGPENHLFQFSSVGAAPQDLKYRNEPTKLIVGARNKIRECVTLHIGTVSGHGVTVIGDDNLFMANSHVAHDCKIGNNNVFANSVGLAGHVTVGNRVIFGGMVGVHQFVRIGDLAMISAGSMVGLDIPPFAIAQGDRCHLRGINIIGLERAGLNNEEIAEIKKVFRQLFFTVGHLKDKIPTVPAELAEAPYVKMFLDFLQTSQRGITTPSRSSTSE